MYEHPARERPAPDRLPPASPARRGAFVIPSPALLLFQLMVGAFLVTVITMAVRPMVDERAVRALGLGTMFVVGFVDWRRWREIHWPGYATWAGFIYALAFAVWYLFPD